MPEDGHETKLSPPDLSDIPPGFKLLANGHSLLARATGDSEFEPHSFARRRRADGDRELRYHVFDVGARAEPVSVPARSAIEAIGKAGIARPAKIIRGSATADAAAAVIRAGRLLPVEDAEDAEDEAPMPQETAAEDAAAAAPETAAGEDAAAAPEPVSGPDA